MQADEVLNSGLVKGHMAIHFAKKRRLVQRPPLTVKQIQHLEICVKDESRTMYDRIASGFFLLLVFGRFRFSDGQSISSMELEVPVGSNKGYLECAAERCKTATTLEKRTVEVPLSQPCFEHFCRPCFRGHDEAGLLAFEAPRGSPRPARGQASDAKRNGTRTKRGSRGLESTSRLNDLKPKNVGDDHQPRYPLLSWKPAVQNEDTCPVWDLNFKAHANFRPSICSVSLAK